MQSLVNLSSEVLRFPFSFIVLTRAREQGRVWVGRSPRRVSRCPKTFEVLSRIASVCNCRWMKRLGASERKWDREHPPHPGSYNPTCRRFQNF